MFTSDGFLVKYWPTLPEWHYLGAAVGAAIVVVVGAICVQRAKARAKLKLAAGVVVKKP